MDKIVVPVTISNGGGIQGERKERDKKDGREVGCINVESKSVWGCTQIYKIMGLCVSE